MSELFFCDTNVLVYAADSASAEKQERAQHLLRSHSSQLVISTQVLLEYASACTRKLGITPEQTTRLLASLSQIRTAGADRESVQQAARMSESTGLSIYDAMIVEAAQRMRCGTLFTEDAALLAADLDITVSNPFA